MANPISPLLRVEELLQFCQNKPSIVLQENPAVFEIIENLSAKRFVKAEQIAHFS